MLSQGPLSDFHCLLGFPTKGRDLSKDDYPIALGYMASLVRMNGGAATITALNVDDYCREHFENKTMCALYPMVASLGELLRYIALIRADFPKLPIVLFNSEQHQHEMILNSPRARDFALTMIDQCPAIDAVLVGESEQAFISLCAHVQQGSLDWSTIPACIYRRGQQIVESTVPIRASDFHFLPFPSRDYLEERIGPQGYNLSSVRIQSARGCVAPCTYCIEASSNLTINGRKVPLLRRPMREFVDEIELLSSRYKTVFFNVIDSSFEDSGSRGIERLHSFCDEIEKRNILASFKVHFRAETVCKLSDDFLTRLKHAGVDIIGIGVESGLDKELKAYRKIATKEQSQQAVTRIEAGDRFFCIVGHMMFSPILGLEELPLKLDFLGTIDRAWDYLDLSNNVIIFPGTMYHRHVEGLGLTSAPSALSGSVPYCFLDPRVGRVAHYMGMIKTLCPEVITVANRLYDALNIVSRFHNRMNQHLYSRVEFFQAFQETLSVLKQHVARVLSSYFLELVDLVGRETPDSAIQDLYQDCIPAFYKKTQSELEEAIDTLLRSYEESGLSTTTLTLKTWMSIINTQINTAGGVSNGRADMAHAY